jgi:hypothetical protein
VQACWCVPPGLEQVMVEAVLSVVDEVVARLDQAS